MFSILKSQQNKKAVCYYRHSAEDKQENSVAIQREQAELFAAKHNIEIIHEEADEGVSGLIANRPGFKRLFKDWVQNSNSPHFDYVLFYDISRWGRFLDQDEGAYYAFICKQNGKTLVNVYRGFPQEGQEMMTSIVNSVDRAMAAEYSRVLSGKVWFGCIKVSQQGYSAGGTSCYGMARLLLDESKKPIGILKKGEHKLISNQRVSFTPLGDETTQAVKDMFELLVHHWKTPNEIAEIMNDRGVFSAKGGLWNREKIIRILTNQTYTGTRVYNKTWGRLKQRKRDNPKTEWVVTPNAFDGIVSLDLFNQAQEHLYWLMPSRWKKGIYVINRVRMLALKEIEQLLVRRGLHAGKVETIMQRFPLTFIVSFNRNSVPHWCFTIDESARKYDYVLGITLVLEKRDPIDKLFLLPTKDFNTSNFIVCSERDPNFPAYKIEQDQLEEKISMFQEACQA